MQHVLPNAGATCSHGEGCRGVREGAGPWSTRLVCEERSNEVGRLRERLRWHSNPCSDLRSRGMPHGSAWRLRNGARWSVEALRQTGPPSARRSHVERTECARTQVSGSKVAIQESTPTPPATSRTTPGGRGSFASASYAQGGSTSAASGRARSPCPIRARRSAASSTCVTSELVSSFGFAEGFALMVFGHAPASLVIVRRWRRLPRRSPSPCSLAMSTGFIARNSAERYSPLRSANGLCIRPP